MLFLTAFLAAVWWWMRRTHRRPVEGRGWWSVGRLGVRNAARHPARSLLTAGLLASAAFLLVAVESFRRRAEAGEGGIKAPDGGFALIAESDLPVLRDLNSREGRAELLQRLELGLRDVVPEPAERKERLAVARALLEQVTIIGLRLRSGDDASCLNLYQPRQPRVLGVPQELINRGGFVFDAARASSDEEKANPWTILDHRGEGEAIPAFGEANTVTWMLKSGLDKTFPITDERGRQTPLLIAGLLHDSVYQSSLLISEQHFLSLYPSHEGYQFFLIRTPPGKEDEVKRVLEMALADRGFEVTRSADRLQQYLQVENTYLLTFQALGGLGLLLGSLGLAVVLLRAVWERRGELALLRALGYRRSMLGWLVLAENGFLLLVGLAAGTLAAVLSVAPHLLRAGGAVQWPDLAELLGLLAVVLVVGLLAGLLAVAGTLRAPLVPALRRE
jgi:hypothetical protein